MKRTGLTIAAVLAVAVLGAPAYAQYGGGYGGGGYGGGPPPQDYGRGPPRGEGYGGGGGGGARGSFRRTCTDISQDGPMVEATCRTARGDERRSSIDVGRCGGRLGNRNGRLVCE